MRGSRALYLLLRFLLDAIILGGVALAASYVALILIEDLGNHLAVIILAIILIGVLLLWIDEQLARMQ
jgi:hypothetical protein